MAAPKGPSWQSWLTWNVPALGLLVLALARHGFPLDGWTWVFLLSLATLAAVAAACRRSWLRNWLCTSALLGCAYVALPEFCLFTPMGQIEHWRDSRGGRVSVVFHPHLRFGKNGPNTALLEHYLGPLPPHWFSQATTYPVMVKVRDGGERVRGASLVFRDDLRDILARLPDDNAREQVLACITDPANRLRVHQGMLLVCLNVLGYPRGYDASRWWERHRAVFIREPDPEKAVAVVLGWTESAERLVDQNPDLADVGEISGQARSARYQQWGVWGGDRDFGEMFSAFVERKHPDGNVPENPNVVWWQRVWWQQK